MTNIQHKVELATYVACPRLGVKYEHVKFKYFKTEELAKWYVSVLNTVNKPKVGAAAINVLFAVHHGEETI
jgi:hypothetical protein